MDPIKTLLVIEQLEGIQKRIDSQGEALSIASKAMEDAHSQANDTVKFIRKMDDRPMTHNEREILQKVYSIAKTLCDASVEIRFK